MKVKPSLIFLLIALAMVSKVQSFPSSGWKTDATFLTSNDIGEYIGENNELLMESESSRRSLAQRRSYIGYGALKANQVPCGQRGHSYYNCQKRQRANPYKRGCSAITHCARFTG